MFSSGRARRTTVGMAVLLVVGAVAVLILVADDDRPASVVSTGTGPGASTTTPTTASTTEEPTTTTAAGAPSSTTTTASPTTVRAAPTSTAPKPTTTTAPPPQLDPAPRVCSPGDARPPASAALLGVVKADGIHEVALDGSADYLVPDTALPTDWPAMMLQPQWTPDARWLAYSRPPASRKSGNGNPAYDLVVADLQARCSTNLTSSGQDSFDSVSWAPDGSKLAYLRRVGGGLDPASSSLETVRPDGSGVTRLRTGTLNAVWAPDGSGRLTYGHDGSLKVRRPDGREVVADPTRGGAEFPMWSPDSRRIVYGISVDQGVWVAEADGGGVRNLAPTDPSNGIFWCSWSPDGTRVAFGWGPDIWTVDADGTDARRVASGGGGFSAPLWSPDGKSLAYNGGGGVWIVGADGTDPRLVVKNATLAAFFRRA